MPHFRKSWAHFISGFLKDFDGCSSWICAFAHIPICATMGLIVIHSGRVGDGRMRVPGQGRARYVTSQPETTSLNPLHIHDFFYSNNPTTHLTSQSYRQILWDIYPNSTQSTLNFPWNHTRDPFLTKPDHPSKPFFFVLPTTASTVQKSAR